MKVRRPLAVTHHRLESDSPIALEALRSEFRQRHIVRLAGFIDPSLLDDFHRRLRRAAFISRVEDGVEIEHTLADATLEALLILPLNDPQLLTAIEAITGCGHIGCFTGRIFRREAAERGHYYPWHSDASHDRVVGLSVNLGREPHDGGILQMRRVGASTLLAEASNVTAGDALLFRIDEDIEHHVTPVVGRTGRTVLAGWFRRRPEFWARAFAERGPL